MVITVVSSRTIQDFARNITGDVANAATLMSLNKLTSPNLTPGQKINVPDNLISASARQRMAQAKAATESKGSMLPLALIAGMGLFFVMKKTKDKASS